MAYAFYAELGFPASGAALSPTAVFATVGRHKQYASRGVEGLAL